LPGARRRFREFEAMLHAAAGLGDAAGRIGRGIFTESGGNERILRIALEVPPGGDAEVQISRHVYAPVDAQGGSPRNGVSDAAVQVVIGKRGQMVVKLGSQTGGHFQDKIRHLVRRKGLDLSFADKKHKKTIEKSLLSYHQEILSELAGSRQSESQTKPNHPTPVDHHYGSPQELVKTSKYRRFREMAFLGTLGS
jgi:hypothetical protein